MCKLYIVRIIFLEDFFISAAHIAKYRKGHSMKQHIYLLQLMQAELPSRSNWKAEDNGVSKMPLEHPQNSTSGPISFAKVLYAS